MNRITDYAELQGRIVSWLNEYKENTGLNCFVIGVSGGIDSAVSSTLAAETGEPVYAIGMPINQLPGQVELSEAHLDWLDKKYKNVTVLRFDLTDTFNTFCRYSTESRYRPSRSCEHSFTTSYGYFVPSGW